MVHDTPALLKAARARETASQALADVRAQQPEIDALTADVQRLLTRLEGGTTREDQD